MTQPRIVLVTPAPPGSRHGNRTTALRWARILREFGFRVAICGSWDGSPCDALVALHARKSAGSIRRFARQAPRRPLIVALTGTDLYLDLKRSATTRRSLEIADRLVVLHPAALLDLPGPFRPKTRVILQSLDLKSLPLRESLPADAESSFRSKLPPSSRPDPGRKRLPRTPVDPTFDVCVVAHLRTVKDPLLTARAARCLPASSRVRVLQIGGIGEHPFEAKLRSELARNPRLEWVGDLTRGRALERMRACRILVNSSLAEGGANAVSEAIVLGVPVLASRVSGNVGLLGEDYAGYFPARAASALAGLIQRCEDEPSFVRRLTRQVTKNAFRFSPERERRAWSKLLRELDLAVRTKPLP